MFYHLNNVNIEEIEKRDLKDIVDFKEKKLKGKGKERKKYDENSHDHKFRKILSDEKLRKSMKDFLEGKTSEVILKKEEFSRIIGDFISNINELEIKKDTQIEKELSVEGYPNFESSFENLVRISKDWKIDNSTRDSGEKFCKLNTSKESYIAYSDQEALKDLDSMIEEIHGWIEEIS